jgi:3-oxoacyl-[acyl-carrier protein] reductase
VDLQLAGKAAMVTGSSRGIGLAIAELLLEEGAKVGITGRNADRLLAEEQRLAQRFGAERITSVPGDLTAGESAVRGCVSIVAEKLGGLDILVANLGSGSGVVGLSADADEWDRLMRINLMATVVAVRSAVPYLKHDGGGSIVLVSSIVALEAVPAPLPYSAAKAALNSLAKNLSRQLAGERIRVNVVTPGNVLHQGGSWERKLGDDEAGVMRYIDSEVPMKRFGSPVEVAKAVAFLASDSASGFTTGANLLVDGGQSRVV